MSFVLIFIRKIFFGTMMKAAIGAILSNPTLQREVFFWLAEIVAKHTDNTMDDKLVEILKQNLGEVDLTELKKLGG
tara:strand:+ start:375 stop:602 length:228 start_codon:yes stop_codon:yes gene_type:complete